MLRSKIIDLLSRPELCTKCLDNPEDRIFIADFLTRPEHIPKFIIDEMRQRLIEVPKYDHPEEKKYG